VHLQMNEIKNTVRSLNLTSKGVDTLGKANSRFPIRITPHVCSLIDPGNPDDPVGKQFIPSKHELTDHPGESSDPLKEADYMPVPGLIHKYSGRVLVLANSNCAVHCRFCFRKSAVYPENSNAEPPDLLKTRSYVKTHREIKEVILSGGDPLTLSDESLSKMIVSFSSISHVETLRIHTRMITADPSRITDDLIRVICSGKPLWMVLHINHPQEWSTSASEACRRLADAGIPLLNQTVLLRGVNDRVNTLADLSRLLIRNRIRPYYLHLLDRAPGTNHFAVPLDRARQLIHGLREQLPGFAVPQLVQDIPGNTSKTVQFD
jgi:lysine 2,3-aminomutase